MLMFSRTGVKNFTSKHLGTMATLFTYAGPNHLLLLIYFITVIFPLLFTSYLKGRFFFCHFILFIIYLFVYVCSIYSFTIKLFRLL